MVKIICIIYHDIRLEDTYMRHENTAESLETSLNNEAVPLDPELVVLMKEEVDRTKHSKLPVNRAFEVIAKKSGLKFNTVRNYYYRYIHEKDNQYRHNSNSKRSRNRTKRDQGVAGNSFKEDEVKKLVMTMLQAQAQGESVRGCANNLANGDPKLMLRYQNKYRNIIANKQEYVKKLMKEMNLKGIKYYDPFKKICINRINFKHDTNNDWVQKGSNIRIDFVDSASSDEELLEVVGQLTANMREINGESFGYLFKGLRDLSEMAIRWKKREEQSAGRDDNLNNLEERIYNHRKMLREKDCEIQELNTRVLSYESRLEEQRNKIGRLMSMFHQLMSINRSFLNLSSAGKLSGLQEYTNELESLVKSYDMEIAD